MSASKNVDLPPPGPKKVANKKPKAVNSATAAKTAKEAPGNRAKVPGIPAKAPKKPNQSTITRNAFDLSFRPNESVASGHGPRSDEGKEFEDLSKKLAYNDYLESLFLETLVDEKIAREKTELDVKMAELATRLEMDKLILRQTNARLLDISFLAEQQRIIDEQELDTEKFSLGMDQFDSEIILENLNTNQDLYCDRLHLKNVDIGYTEDTAYEKLYKTIVEASESLERVRAECKLDTEELRRAGRISADFEECSRADKIIDKNLEDCRKILPEVCGNVLEAVSNELAQVIT